MVTAGLPSVALRIPAHPVALRLMQLAEVPVAAPSANRFMHLSPTTAEHVRIGLGDRVDMILDGGPAQVGIESTVVSLTGKQPVILRPGMITPEELQAATGIEWGEFSLPEPHISTDDQQARPNPRGSIRATTRLARHSMCLRQEVRGPKDADVCSSFQRSQRLTRRSYTQHSTTADNEGWDWIAVEEPPRALNGPASATGCAEPRQSSKPSSIRRPCCNRSGTVPAPCPSADDRTTGPAPSSAA